MAWSDAARKAALEARRAHAKEVSKGRAGSANIRKAMHHYSTYSPTKSAMLKEFGTRTKYDVASPRQKVAYELKAIRSGRATVSGLSASSVARIAAVMTQYRNADKKRGLR